MGGTEVITNGPQGSPPSNWSAQQNVRQSERYDRLLETNRGFREARMRRECGPITDPELHQQCIASFGQDEPLSGSSSSRRHNGITKRKKHKDRAEGVITRCSISCANRPLKGMRLKMVWSPTHCGTVVRRGRYLVGAAPAHR